VADTELGTNDAEASAPRGQTMEMRSGVLNLSLPSSLKYDAVRSLLCPGQEEKSWHLRSVYFSSFTFLSHEGKVNTQPAAVRYHHGDPRGDHVPQSPYSGTERTQGLQSTGGMVNITFRGETHRQVT
jgi:hypothetical protein